MHNPKHIRKMAGKFGIIIRFVLLPLITLLAANTAVMPASMRLSLQDAPLSIPKGGSATKKIVGIPFAVQGKIIFQIKWHAERLLPAYNRLTIVLIHGTTEMRTESCYSVHSPEMDKCYFEFPITQEESLKALDWKLKITNGPLYNVHGFNVQKELTDINPLVPNVRTTFVPSCVAQNLVLSGVGSFPVARASAAEQNLRIFSALPGTINLKAKWHTEGAPYESREVFSPTYADLKLTLFNETGGIVRETTCFSFHAPRTPKCSFTASVPAGTDTRQWKLRIENRHSVNLVDFNIRKGLDLNPLVPSFESTFTPTCN